MSGKVKSKARIKKLFISKENYERILMWSLSKKEISFICLGKANSIEKVVRLTNISRMPLNTMCTSEKQYDFITGGFDFRSLKTLASGHSHPKHYHPRHPSSLDVKWLEKESIELIAFPTDHLIRGWVIKSNLKKTLEEEVKIFIN